VNTTVAELAYIGLGSNLGDRDAALAFARERLDALPETRVVATSPIEQTEPLGGPPQGPYLNQIVLVATELAPRALLEACLAIEQAYGRERRERWGARTLDLDIVRYGDRQIAEPGLEVPHPGLPDRPFWQRGLMALSTHEH
jgi:2-amino-4-hydroxy-6-hydroxymethyldihydropteridine diphosphokinase